MADSAAINVIGVRDRVPFGLELRGNGTLLRLTLAGFPDEESRKAHDQAWPLVLEQLDQRMAALG